MERMTSRTPASSRTITEPSPSPRLQFVGWRPGLQTIAVMKLLRSQAGLDLMQAKTLVEEVMTGQQRFVELEDIERANRLAEEVRSLGMKVEVVR